MHPIPSSNRGFTSVFAALCLLLLLASGLLRAAGRAAPVLHT